MSTGQPTFAIFSVELTYLLTWVCDCVCFSEDRRTASVIALPPGVECLTVDREYVTHVTSLVQYLLPLSLVYTLYCAAACLTSNSSFSMFLYVSFGLLVFSVFVLLIYS